MRSASVPVTPSHHHTDEEAGQLAERPPRHSAQPGLPLSQEAGGSGTWGIVLDPSGVAAPLRTDVLPTLTHWRQSWVLRSSTGMEAFHMSPEAIWGPGIKSLA